MPYIPLQDDLPGIRGLVAFRPDTGRALSGFGEGKTFLGFKNVTTSGSGNATFSATFTASTFGSAPSPPASTAASSAESQRPSDER